MSSSTHRLIMEEVQTAIRALDLDGIDDADVVILKDTTSTRIERLDIGIPGVGIMHSGESEQYDGEGSTNTYEEIGYPVLVVFFDNDRVDGEPSQTDQHDKRLYWRERVTMEFLNRPLLANPQVCRCTMDARPVFIPAEWRERSVWISHLLFRFWARVLR